ncbi:MAG TPA: HpcH/HpaI aldolase/citrate lyase family protein [Methylomirabilota bacterium]|jgi:2-keto-3-deoxy-L-rhamnonate aldolase RhmA|nr:HpcH/HpaI aldolase/citrate lyase family protein [Methylomirabilota bacterium]
MEWVKTNHVKRALRDGRPTAGAWLHLCSGISAEIMSRAGFDWLLIDMEHGHGDYQTLLAQLQAIEGSPVIPVVRVQWNDAAVIKRVLDLGAYGVMVPWVGNRAEVEAAVRASKYPPAGIRGIAGSHRAGGYGRQAAEYWKRANDEILVVIQIETAGAVGDIEAIVQVPGVDVVFIGPADLSTGLGHMGDPGHPVVQAAFERIETAAKAHGIALGNITRNWEQARELYKRGYQFLTLGSDTALVVQGANELVARFAKEVRGT